MFLLKLLVTIFVFNKIIVNVFVFTTFIMYVRITFACQMSSTDDRAIW